MQKITGIFLLFLCIIMVLIVGCASQTAPAPTTPPPTPIPIPTPVFTIVSTTVPMVIPTNITTTTIPAADPILHRWIRVIFQANPPKGYEWKFYPDGTVTYHYGLTKMVSSNIVILTPVEVDASGTWSKLGENKYMIKILPTGTSGAQIIREYTLVPAYIDPAYPGITIPEHIESSYEKDSINKGQIKQADEMYYPERAKID